MTAWPKSFYAFGANLLTAGAEWRLRQKRSALGAQKRTFAVLTGRLATTAFWRDAGVAAAMSYNHFQARVAPRGYAQLEPAIARMRRGEANVLWPGRCAFFAVAAGTTGGPVKSLPVTGEMLGHFRRAGLDSLLYYTVRVKHAAVFRGRHLYLGGSTALTPLAEAQPHEAYAGDLSGITTLNLPAWVEKHFYEPGATIARLADSPEKLAALVARTRALDITLLAGRPHWALLVAAALRASSGPGTGPITDLQGLWPNFECFIHGGAPIGPFQDELRAALGPTVKFHEVYPAAEGFIAAQDVEPGSGLRLLTDVGIFYEFIPMADFDESRLDQLGGKVVPLEDVKTAVDYALLLTTPAGLARYVIGDVVRFTSLEPPRLMYVGRTQLKLDARGDNVTEKELTDALVGVCRRNGWSIVNFHVATLFAHSLTGQNRRRHEWWVELRPGTTITPTGTTLAVELDLALQKLHGGYAARRTAGTLEAPAVRLVMPGVFEHWLRFRHKWGAHYTLPRYSGDRLIADELAQITRFARN